MAEKEQRGQRKVLQGVVKSTKMQKTIVVEVERKVRHPKYQKSVGSRKKYYAHTEDEKKFTQGDLVTIVETRHLSKLKCWRVLSTSEQS